MRISIDIDGVLSKFTDQVVAIAEKLWPGRLPENYIPTSWDYTDVFTKQDWDKVWEAITATENFWEQSSPYEGNVRALAQYLNTPGRDVFFVTSRAKTKGDPLQTQTWRWFRKNDIPAGGYTFERNFAPVVPVVSSKFKKQTMEALGIEASIDDYGPTVEMCNQIPGHQAFVLDRPWNQDKDYGPRVFTLEEFLKKVQ